MGGAPRCQSQEWANQDRKQGSKEAGFQCHHRLRGAPNAMGPRYAGTTRERREGGSPYTLRRQWFRARAPRPLNPPNSRQTQNDGHSRGARLPPSSAAFRSSSRASQPTHIKYTYHPAGPPPTSPRCRHFRSPPTCHRRPLPFPDNIWRSRGGTSGSPQVPKLHFRGAQQESPRPQTVSS